MDKTLQSLHILRYINNQIKRYLYSLHNEVSDKVDGNSLIYLGVRSIIIILAKSFKDEWNDGLIKLTEEKDKEKLIELKRKASPIIERINKWRDIDECRNSLLAHNFRKNKNHNCEIAFLGNHIDSFNIPEHISEIYLLSKLIDLATKIVTEPYQAELEETYNNLYKTENCRVPNAIDEEAEIKEVLSKIIS